MCLSYNYTAAREEATEEAARSAHAAAETKLSQHADVSCDGTQVGIFHMKDDSYVQVNRIPITSSSAVMAMVSAPRFVLGDDHEYIQPCESLPCLQAELAAAMDPGAYVPIPEYTEVPVYRSLACTNTTPTYVLPEIELEPGVCVANADGSKIMTLRTADVAEPDENVQAQIDAGKYRDKTDYLIAMKNATWKEFARGCAANDVDVKALFECEKDASGKDMVAPEAIVTFMDNFYPCLLPGSDIIVLLPPIVDGKAVMNTAFNLLLTYPTRPQCVWLPGLHHNDADVEGDDYTQEENYFIWTNARFALKIPNMKTDIIRVCESHEFLPFVPTVYAWGRTEQDCYDYDAWGMACARFQEKRHKAIMDALCGVFQMKTEKTLLMTNLIGTEIPKIANHATVCDFVPMSGNAHTNAMRQLMKNRKRGDA